MGIWCRWKCGSVSALRTRKHIALRQRPRNSRIARTTAFLPGTRPAVTDAAKLFEWAAASYGPDLGPGAVAFKDQTVSRLHSEQLANSRVGP
jgi:hypothetical protein